MTRVDETHSGQTIREAVGETVELSLGERPTTGHLWEVVSDGDPVCSLQGSSFAPSSGRPGAGGVRRWTFRVDRPGDAEIALVYRRPWEKAARGREFRLRVRGEVSAAQPGGPMGNGV